MVYPAGADDREKESWAHPLTLSRKYCSLLYTVATHDCWLSFAVTVVVKLA